MQLVLNFSGNTTAVEVPADFCVEDLKCEFAQSQNIDEETLMVLNQGIQLEDSACIAQLGLTELNIEIEALGEGKGKRKKKIYKTAKRIPHKHVNVKMRALKYYSLQSNGEVKTTLKLCPEEQCKGGVFMSDHWNRCYCGKCGLTLIKENAPKEPPKKKVVVKVEEEVVKKAPKGKK
jgi:ribosomal protein S27AE